MEQNAKKKISCGGFMLGEGLVLSEDGKTLSVSGGGGAGVLIVNLTEGPEEGLLVADKTVAEIIAAARTQLVFAQYSAADTSVIGVPRFIAGPLTCIRTGQFDGVEATIVYFAGCWNDSKEGALVGGIQGVSANGVDQWSYYA